MKSFKDLGITVETKAFTGEKISVDKIINCEIIVHGYKVEKSKINTRNCLHIQIEYKSEMRLVFTGSIVLEEQLKQVPSSGFPFKTTIIKNDKRLEFT